ncbi:hypothetical protein OGH69_00935 [Flavobacterium sp. MFBS3-15]|uniref:hypothetical protein n=1 Tax=Flavobacterium sp. MFBS3-15 TaxID=2989816 RepID=UPI00223631F8|nr:hypothetical protein [Flavobacterium sp. MFBS3-15]MCW4467519.1 hypothetical protein [Flavobacterium sp. MFBS3-15]
MKRIAVLMALAIAFFSCNSRYEQENDDKGNIMRKTSEKTPFTNYSLEMRGNFDYSEDGVQITGVPEGGYANYSYNDIEIEVRKGKGNAPEISIYEKGEKVAPESEKGRDLLEDAIGRMQDLQERYE